MISIYKLRKRLYMKYVVAINQLAKIWQAHCTDCRLLLSVRYSNLFKSQRNIHYEKISLNNNLGCLFCLIVFLQRYYIRGVRQNEKLRPEAYPPLDPACANSKPQFCQIPILQYHNFWTSAAGCVPVWPRGFLPACSPLTRSPQSWLAGQPSLPVSPFLPCLPSISLPPLTSPAGVLRSRGKSASPAGPGLSARQPEQTSFW